MKAEHDNSGMIGLCHVGMYAKDPASLAEFYRDVMGMEVVGGSDGSHPLGPSAFLSSRPVEESHEIAMFGNPELAHRAFKVESLAALKQFYHKIVAHGIAIKFQFFHGVSIAFYFDDPEGNLIEVYWPTGLQCRQPCAQEIDLTRTEEELMQRLKVLTTRIDSTSSADQSANQVKHVPAGTGPLYWGPGDRVTFLVRGAESGGACFIVEVLIPPGGGPPPHIHRREEESFYLLQGTLTIQAAGRTFQALPGDFVHIPRGTVHTFRNDGKVDAKMIVVVSPAGPAGLEKFFGEAFYPATNRLASPPLITEELMERMMTAAARNGLEFVLPQPDDDLGCTDGVTRAPEAKAAMTSLV